MSASRNVVAMAMLVAAMGLSDISFGQISTADRPVWRGANPNLYRFASSSTSRSRRKRTGNKAEPFKDSQKADEKTVTVTGTVSSTPGSQGMPPVYSLRGDDNKNYMLIGHETDLIKFITQRAQVSGRLTVKSTSRVIEVETVKATVAR